MRKGRRSRSRAPRGGREDLSELALAQSASSESPWEWEAERVEQLRERAWRWGPRGPDSGGKGRSRREREQRSNWAVPAGHERKIATKLRASLAKRRRREQKRGAAAAGGGRARLAAAVAAAGRGGSGSAEGAVTPNHILLWLRVMGVVVQQIKPPLWHGVGGKLGYLTESIDT
ncbi:nuclear protein 2 [Hemicordylus capensis]|uniref:nuclear protein 2 n=1 Tax=Hemicordylus capensis TaxID=884348 RepID=UPI0023024901|nr:nuclear protein 2 [Hemicordylus capensis]